LLNSKNRPEFSSYFTIKPPKALNYDYAPYVDGTRLNETIPDDYMYGFKPTPAETDLEGNYHPADPGDEDLLSLSKQFPWNLRNRMIFKYVEGKKTIVYD
jgi:hypothetical protein